MFKWSDNYETEWKQKWKNNAVNTLGRRSQLTICCLTENLSPARVRLQLMQDISRRRSSETKAAAEAREVETQAEAENTVQNNLHEELETGEEEQQH
mmetsp:Transcript_42527/g.51645  ORF Transcript_42527/g.51645 Transcript_42527/m.51645 type:complete len:97 (+) Transcript_42527:90-380(+)